MANRFHRRNLGYWQIGALAFLIGASVSVSRAEETPTDVLDRLKAATVFIKASTSLGEQTGSGFLIERKNGGGHVVTNAHVIMPANGMLRRVQCVLHSGTRKELVVDGEVTGVDEGADLAVLQLKHQDLPEPLDMAGEVALRETLQVLALGFPFGEVLATNRRNPAITVTPTTISSIRRDDYDKVSRLQLSGGVNPGNSGGPVVTADGRFVGVAVAKLRGADIGFAIPKSTLDEVLAGRPTHVRSDLTSDSGGEKQFKILAKLFDPYGNIQDVTCLVCPTSDVEQKQPDAEGNWRQVCATMTQTKLKLDRTEATGVIRSSGKTDKWTFQLRWTLRDGSERFSAPLQLIASSLGPANRPNSPPMTSPPNGRPSSPMPAPNSPVSDLTKIRATQLPVEAAALVPWLAWSRDELHCFTLTKQGRLQKHSLQGEGEMKQAELNASCSFLGQSQAGLVVVFDATQEVCLIDETSLEVTRKVRVPGASRVACAPASRFVYVPSGSAITAVDMSTGETKPMKFERKLGPNSSPVNRFDTKFLTLSPDGKYLFAEGGIEMLQRMRVDGDVAVLEELSPRIGQNSQDIVIGSDSRLVAMPAGGGNYPVEGHPHVSYGTYIYEVDNLRSPKLAISTGPYPRTLAFDPVAKKIYAQNHVRQLIVLNEGGTVEDSFIFPGGTDARRFLVHPKGHRLCVLTSAALFWIELPSAPEPLKGRES